MAPAVYKTSGEVIAVQCWPSLTGLLPPLTRLGIGAVCDLYNDDREVYPLVAGGFHMKDPFKRMRVRHDL